MVFTIFLSPARRCGGEGIGVSSNVGWSVHHASGWRIFVSGAELCNPSMDFLNFWHTHPLEGVDVPFGVFEILPT